MSNNRISDKNYFLLHFQYTSGCLRTAKMRSCTGHLAVGWLPKGRKLYSIATSRNMASSQEASLKVLSPSYSHVHWNSCEAVLDAIISNDLSHCCFFTLHL